MVAFVMICVIFAVNYVSPINCTTMKKQFLLATFCLLLAANMFAQLRVRPQGTAMLGNFDFVYAL